MWGHTPSRHWYVSFLSNRERELRFLTRADMPLQEKMEEWSIDNIRLALKTGKLKSPIFEQEHITS
jgi:hypothetical protein